MGKYSASESEDDGRVSFDLANVDSEDVRQQMHLNSLQGKGPSSYKITQLFLETKGDRAVLYGLGSGAEEQGMSPWEAEKFPSSEVIEKLLQWSLAQSTIIQERIWDFLENPEEEYEETLRFLKKKALIKRCNIRQMEKGKGKSLNSILLRNLPATQEQLVSFVRLAHPTKRPEATVRQFIRRNTRKGVISHVKGSPIVLSK